MRLAHGEVRLPEQLRNCLQVWNGLDEHWRDDRRRSFEQEHIEPLVANLEEACRALAELTALSERIIHRCQ
jgi:hypothetical protein